MDWLGEAGGAGGPLRTLADIWATVEIERALADLGNRELGPPPGGALTDDPLLGARVAIVSTGDTRIAIAEPSTEGRLAATLARHGEGPAGRYALSPVGLDTVRSLAAAAG